MKTSLISILCLLFSLSLVSCQKIDVTNVSVNTENQLDIEISLEDVTSDIFAILNVEVLSETEVIAISSRVNLIANTPIQDVTVDVGANINLNGGDVAVKVDVLEIISLDLNVDIGDNIVGNLLDGALEQVSGLFQNLFDALFSNSDVTIEIINSQLLQGGRIQVSLQLLDNVLQALPVELNVEVMVGSELINLDTSVATFSGNQDEVINVFLDLSVEELADIELSDIDVSVQVSLSVLNLLDVNVDVGVELQGLNELLDVIFDAIESAESSNIQVASSIEISDVSLDQNEMLTVTLQVDGDIDASLSVDVHVVLFGNEGELLNLDGVVSLDGIDGETAEITFNLSGQVDLDINVFAMVSLSNLTIDANIDVSLGDLEVFTIVDGNLNELVGNLLGSL